MHYKPIAVFIFWCIACIAEIWAQPLPLPKDFTEYDTRFDHLRIHQFQTLGSHNSYHLRANKPVLNFLKSIRFILPKSYNPQEMDYAHEPLRVQLDSFHLRSFEIDLYADPEGGQFYYRKKNNLLGKRKASGIAELKEPGFKVLHIPDIDYNTHYFTFQAMLADLLQWSLEHPQHFPIYLLIEAKEETLANHLKKLRFTPSIPYTPDICNNLDEEVSKAFQAFPDKLITPDMVRGKYATLKEAVTSGNWPTLGDARGKFIFILMENDAYPYSSGHPSLEGRLMFTFTTPNAEEAAFIKYDDPAENNTKIEQAVRQGFIVRTRADYPNYQNRSGDSSQLQAALLSGAQIISSDYYRPDMRYQKKPRKFTPYATSFAEGKNARINPVSNSRAEK